MAYITFEQYQALGGSLSQEGFDRAEPFAESVLDNATLNRLKDERSEKGDPSAVLRAMAILIERADSIREGFAGSKVTSFSNGVDSFSFADTAGNDALSSTLAEVSLILPVELISADVSYNYAG